MDGTPNAATFGSPNPDAGAYGNNSSPSAPMNTAVPPMVQQLQNFGRNNDSQLVHMTPGEVGGLQALAQAHGGSLTTNPTTGLPEAGFLENILPTLLGVGLSFIPGVGPLMAAGITGIGTTAVTGDLNKGLMAGLGAFGGASLAGGLGIGAASATAPGATLSTALPAANTATVAGSQIGIPQAAQAANAAMSAPGFVTAPTAAFNAAGSNAASAISGGATLAPAAAATAPATAAATTPNMLTQVLGPDLGAKAGTFGQKFANSAGQNLMGTATNPSVMKTGLAAMGVANPVLSSMQPEYKPYEAPKSKWNYEGPYKPQDRKVRFPTSTPTDGEFSYFEDTNPYPGYLTSKGALPEGFAEGGAAGGGMPEISPQELAAFQAQTRPQVAQTLPPPQTFPAFPSAPQPNPAQFTTVQSPPAASIYGAPQMQPAPQRQMTGIQEARAGLPSMQDFLGSMKRAPTAGPTAFTPFKTEKETIEAAKVKPTTTTTTTTTTPTTGTGTSPTTVTPPGGTRGGRDGYYGGTGNDTSAWVDPTIDPTQWDPNIDYTGGVDLSGLDFSNIGGSGGSYTGNGGVDEGQRFVDNMDLSNLSSYDPEQFKRDIAMGNYGGSDINGNPFVGGVDDSVRVDETGMPGPEDIQTFPAFDPNMSYGDFQPTNTFDLGGYQSDYGNFSPADFGGASNDLSYNAVDYGDFQPTNTFDLGGYQSDFGNFSPADFGVDNGASNYNNISPSDYGAFSPTDYSAFSPADYGVDNGASNYNNISPSDYGMDYSGMGFGGIGNDFGFDQGDYGLFAKGGQVPLEDGAFIVDARTVSELGNGSSRAGQDLLAQYGGKTLHGPGDGVSDSIRANIGGKQDARVARDEVKFSPDAVARIGGGDLHKGTKKLYAMMDRAQKARQSAQRGQNTGLQGILSR